jgi:hypothetical protein
MFNLTVHITRRLRLPPWVRGWQLLLAETLALRKEVQALARLALAVAVCPSLA